MIVTIVLCAAMFARAQSAYSEHIIEEGIRRGDTLFSLFAGGASPTNATFDVNVSGKSEEMKWGKTGVEYGVSILYFVHDYVGFGLEASGMNSTYARKWIGNTEYKTATDLWNGMIVGRLNFNPYQSVRMYLPVGLGLTWARNRWKTNDDQTSPTEKSLSYGYFVGIGLETNFDGLDKSVGVEVRYNGFGADLDNRLGVARMNGKHQMEYVSVLFKLSYRF